LIVRGFGGQRAGLAGKSLGLCARKIALRFWQIARRDEYKILIFSRFWRTVVRLGGQKFRAMRPEDRAWVLADNPAATDIKY